MVPKFSSQLIENRRLSSSGSLLPIAITQQPSDWMAVKSTINSHREAAPKGQLLQQRSLATFPRPIAMSPHTRTERPTSESSLDSWNQKPKGRANFSEARKREIKKMREIGSCIRCKMLKKPCSTVTPCVTCGAIDSPRTWKGFPCLRVRLVDMYQGYMLGLNQTLSSRDIDAVKSSMRFVHGTGKLLIKYFADTDPIVLRALEGRTNSSATDPTLSILSNGKSKVVKTIIVDNEANNLPKVLEEYMQKAATRFIEQEASPIIKGVVLRVYQLSRDSGETLSRNVIDLWLLTTMLADSMKRWTCQASQILTQGSARFYYVDGAASFPISTNTDQQSYDLILSQLQCGLERLATKLSTHAMNDFEKRLLRPVSVNQFETFLVAILLINCFERHLWTLHSWMEKPEPVQWPLDNSLASSIAQAEQVITVIAFMIRVRNLTPKITASNAGALLEAEHPHSEKYSQWFVEMGLTLRCLTQRQNAVFDADESISLDLKYSATSLLEPQTPPSP